MTVLQSAQVFGDRVMLLQIDNIQAGRLGWVLNYNSIQYQYYNAVNTAIQRRIGLASTNAERRYIKLMLPVAFSVTGSGSLPRSNYYLDNSVYGNECRLSVLSGPNISTISIVDQFRTDINLTCPTIGGLTSSTAKWITMNTSSNLSFTTDQILFTSGSTGLITAVNLDFRGKNLT